MEMTYFGASFEAHSYNDSLEAWKNSAEMGKLWIARTMVAFPLLNYATCEKQFGGVNGTTPWIHPKKFNFAMTYK